MNDAHDPTAEPRPPEPSDVGAIRELKTGYDRIRAELGKVIVGQEVVLDQLMVVLFAGGHVILEGVPGLAKTLMISTLARCLALSFHRIQFTPDLMPSDITGTEVIQEDRATGQRTFRFLPGPVFANVLLADEINRTPPKTQAALLEAMQERQVTAGEQRHVLPAPFFVLATQNPIEQEGTYPLPEAQQDRFMFKVFVDYPTYEEEYRIAETTTVDVEQSVAEVFTGPEITRFQQAVRRIPAAPEIIRYALDLARMTRPSEEAAPKIVREMLTWGAGPRAVQALLLGAKARAALHGRHHVSFEDVQVCAKPVLRHRVVPNFSASAEGIRQTASWTLCSKHWTPVRRQYRKMTDTASYFRPEVLNRISRLELRARHVVEGLLGGRHKSPYNGFSIEFADRREYVAGDDMRHIDWRLYAKSDRFFIKEYEVETNLRAHILLDASGSMRYPEHTREDRMNKWTYAATLAASLAYLLIQQQDGAGLLLFDHRTREQVPVSTSRAQLARITRLIEQTTPDARTDTKVLFRHLAGQLPARSMVVIISDLLTDENDLIDGLQRFRFSQHDVIVLHLLDQDELEFPFADRTLFEGIEEVDLELLTDPQSLRTAYLERLHAFISRVRGACLNNGINYALISTADPLHVAMTRFLADRMHRTRSRA